jgi:hypothetical protein
VPPLADSPAAGQVRAPRDHHYIPQFYQRKWCGADQRVERYTRVPNGEIHRKRDFPAAVGFQRNLYRHPREGMDEWYAQALEWAVLSKIDDAAAKALDALMSDQSALRDDAVRRDWTIFLRTMLLRTPYQMEGTIASLEKIWRDADDGVSERYAAMRKPGMPETATEYLEMLNPDAARESAFRMFAEAMGADRTTHHIMGLPWRIFDCSVADHRLLLSDHPVALVPLATADGHVAMPLSPTKFLIAATSERTKAIADSIPPKLAVRIMNKLTVQRAQHYVIADTVAQDGFIRKHFGSAPIPPFLGPGKLLDDAINMIPDQ